VTTEAGNISIMVAEEGRDTLATAGSSKMVSTAAGKEEVRRGASGDNGADSSPTVVPHSRGRSVLLEGGNTRLTENPHSRLPIGRPMGDP
jgi:hypothetical protein